jgi:hypothetical protein
VTDPHAELAALHIRKTLAEQQGATLIAAECTDATNAILDRMLAENPELCQDYVVDCE